MGTRVEHVFSRTSTGHLMEAYWSASAGWHWYDVTSAPGGATIAGTPSVASWVESDGTRVETVFAQGTNGHLMEAYWWASQPNGWGWKDVSTDPGGVSIAGNPCVAVWVTSANPLGVETVFARGANSDLEEACWLGDGFNWYDVSTAPGGTAITAMALQRASSSTALPSPGIRPGTAPQSSAAQPGNTVRPPSSPTTETDGPGVAAARTLGRVPPVFAGRVRRPRSRGLLDGLSTGEASLATVGQEFA
jgi:hypothetical protein